MSIKITTNITQFNKEFKANAQLALDASARVINETLQEMYRRIVQRTPIGNPALWNPPYWPKNYQPGTLKNSWVLSFSNTQRSTGGQFASSGQLGNSGGISFKLGSPQLKTAVIYNPQPYAQRVETGWSTQAPQGMMRITIAEFPQLIDKYTRQYKV